MNEPVLSGHFVWYELLTSDTEGAVAFYTDVLGWGTETWPGEEPYTMWTNHGTPIGGIMRLPEDAVAGGAPPHWLPYVATDDVDATVEAARELGAPVYVEPRDIPEVGRFAVLADPQGATFAIYAPRGEPPGRPHAGDPGDFTWHELATSDREAALAFYSELFGWRETDATDMGEMGVYQMYGRDNHTLGGIFHLPEETPHWMLYVQVADIDATTGAMGEAGGEVVNGPMEVPGGGRVAQCRDPQGALFALHEPA